MAFEWTEARVAAAHLIAQGERSPTEIAEEVGVDRATLWRWRQHPSFEARVAEELDAIRMALRHRAIALRERRVAALNQRWLALHSVIEARATDPKLAKAPGGKTGLLTRSLKSIGNGPGARTIEEFTLDTGLLKELRELEKQAAQELGQWIDKTAVQTEPTDGPIDPAAAEAALRALNGFRDGAEVEAEDSEGAA